MHVTFLLSPSSENCWHVLQDLLFTSLCFFFYPHIPTSTSALKKIVLDTGSCWVGIQSLQMAITLVVMWSKLKRHCLCMLFALPVISSSQNALLHFFLFPVVPARHGSVLIQRWACGLDLSITPIYWMASFGKNHPPPVQFTSEIVRQAKFHCFIITCM